MIDIEYMANPDEMSQVTLDFLTNRPLISFMFWLMKLSCMGLLLAFAFTLYNHAARPQDYVSVLSAVVWLIYYKKINRWIIKRGLKRRKFNQAKYTVRMDEKSIFCKLQENNPLHIEWKKIRYVLQNKAGYIIPLTGVRNAGKFVWVPHRSLAEKTWEQDFLQILNKFKLKVQRLK